MASAPLFRTAYDGRSFEATEEYSVDFTGVQSLTHQSFKDECDINLIIDRLDVSGFLNQPGQRTPQYFDASEVPDYQSALNQVIYAQSLFADLDAHVRKRFGNDPAAFVDFFNDPANQDEAIRLGLATSAPEAEGAPQAAEGAAGALPASAGKSEAPAA